MLPPAVSAKLSSSWVSTVIGIQILALWSLACGTDVRHDSLHLDAWLHEWVVEKLWTAIHGSNRQFAVRALPRISAHHHHWMVLGSGHKSYPDLVVLETLMLGQTRLKGRRVVALFGCLGKSWFCDGRAKPGRALGDWSRGEWRTRTLQLPGFYTATAAMNLSISAR